MNLLHSLGLEVKVARRSPLGGRAAQIYHEGKRACITVCDANQNIQMVFLLA